MPAQIENVPASGACSSHTLMRPGESRGYRGPIEFSIHARIFLKRNERKWLSLEYTIDLALYKSYVLIVLT